MRIQSSENSRDMIKNPPLEFMPSSIVFSIAIIASVWTSVVISTAEAVAQTSNERIVDVFVPGNDDYPAIRIPSLVTTQQGTLLAFAEGRQGGDHSQNDIILKRSFDNGKSWTTLQLVHEAGSLSLNNPQSVVLNSGRILLMYQQSKLGEHKALTGFGDDAYMTLTQFSDDDGETWSKPKDVSRQVKRADKVTSVASGPGVGIVLKKGKHKGRVVMPFNQGPFGDWRVYAAYSDDGGESWQMGDVAEGDGKGHGNEVQMVELSNGDILLNARSQGSGTTKRRKTAISSDGGESWTRLQDDPTLIGPVCQASLIRYSWPGESSVSRILFCNPASQTGRKNGTLRMSLDEGKTWEHSVVVDPGPFAYSSIARLANDQVGVLFERNGYRSISFKAVSISDLKSE